MENEDDPPADEDQMHKHDEASKVDQPQQPASIDERIIGKWFGATPKHRDHYYELHFQFNDDGTFIHSTGRTSGEGEGYAPGIKYAPTPSTAHSSS